MTTIKEIAEKSGYSPATVSRLLNNDPELSITAETKNKILKLANQLGYWETHVGKAVKPTVALLYRVNNQEQLQDEYFISLKKKIISISDRLGLKITVYKDVKELIKDAAMFQGFLGVGADNISPESLAKLHDKLPNGIFIDSNPAPNLFDSIKPNLSLTVKDAINQLLKAGYHRIGFIGGEGQKINGVKERDIREVIFREYAFTRDLTRAPIYVSGPFSVDNGYQLGKKAAEHTLPEAFVIASDTLSVGVLQAFNEKQINVPKDVAIVSINNSDIAKYVSPPLTSYNIDQDELVKQAIRMLTDLIMRPDRPAEEVNVNTKLVVRKSFISKD